MSLRSGSPCTYTSMSSSSWMATASRISFCMYSSYSRAVISPLVNLLRTTRMSLVWGNEPMVVVGNSGSLRCCFWASKRAGKADLRVCISGVTACWRCLTSGLLVRLLVALDCMLLALASNSLLTAAVPWVTALAMTATSTAFSQANANQSATSASSEPSLASVCGVCSRELEVATTTRSLPSAWIAASTSSMLLFMSFFQMLRPSTTPADRTWLGPRCCRTCWSCSGWRTRSTCSAWVCFRAPSTTSKLCTMSPKYVASTRFGALVD
mmetsp:Transcript_27133/g.80494  ORF Transcript_27133/g.80494 Transcript_27133/m.80494 type:complete len:268 (+) Transcript_27133:1645-2448(+)